MIVLGIDPGKNGAIARVTNSPRCTVEPTPLMQDESINARALNNMITNNPVDFIMVEKVGPNPRFGVKSCFTFGRCYGQLLSLLQINKIPYDFVAPQTWKARYGLIKKPKNASIDVAMRLFPEAKFKSHDEADAALIGRFGYELNGGANG